LTFSRRSRKTLFSPTRPSQEDPLSEALPFSAPVPPQKAEDQKPCTNTPKHAHIIPGYFSERSCGCTSRLVAFGDPEDLAAAFGARPEVGLLCFPTDEKDCNAVEHILQEIGFHEIARDDALDFISQENLKPQNGFAYRTTKEKKEVILFGEEDLVRDFCTFYWLYGDLAVSIQDICCAQEAFFWSLCVEEECSAFWETSLRLAETITRSYQMHHPGRPVFNMDHDLMKLK